MFKTEYFRNGRNQIIGNATSLENGDVIVRNREGSILGGTSKIFRETRD